ncbi:hypothetical protein BCV69DRAFT_280951 [Microstroma glucosiphilum]|uniref:Uncharacterized protein n=1 Tax=Pseudomicrostroma glucosiphilum TaxID=1684307 RepID=A0A316UDU4_9BASI|nr:hypothetical protein BCV69DRAFT_280951 [Pseudomicrostroma glucosiphilum]PWN23342.1 hypothetical protein BCV69DRAFT_280951 [Pseudomicrostroma glucosiphilum]
MTTAATGEEQAGPAASQAPAGIVQRAADMGADAATSVANSGFAQSASNAVSSAGDSVANATARALGDSATTAHESGDHHEKDHGEIPKAHPNDVPDRMKDHPHLDHPPAVASGDEVRPAEPEIQDLGWSEDPKVPQPVIFGATNENVWVLVRRFNKQVYHVKALPHPPPGELDCNIADKDEFFPDKLRSTLERCYTTVGIGMISLFTHIARVRSWKETRRTALFAGIYFIAFIFGYLVTTFSAFLLLLFVSPRARTILFPPAPLAAISSKGTAQVPKSGHLGSTDSATGAAESYKGEAVEQEASNLVSSISSVAVSTAVGKGAPSVDDAHPDDIDEEDSEKGRATEEALPDPTQVAKKGAEAKSKAAGDPKLEKGDHTAGAVDHSVWTQLQPILHALEDVADTWERFGNALSPTPPFHQYRNRVFIAAALVLPIFLLSLFVTPWMVYHGTAFGIGFGFFGQPAFDAVKLSDARKWLDKNFPKWKEALQLRNSLLKGVPTNAQLTITLLRIAEAAKSPLPPPPPPIAAPKPEASQGNEMAGDVPPEYQQEMKEAVHEGRGDAAPKPDGSTTSAPDAATTKKKSGSKRSLLMGFFKGTVAGGTQGVLTANSAKAVVGSNVSKNRLGVVKKNLQQEARGDGPSSFKGRHKGKRGYVDVITTAATPCVVFEPEWGAHARAAQAAVDAVPTKGDEEGGTEADSAATKQTRSALQAALDVARPKAHFSVQIDEIVELRKIGGLGWKGKIIVGWALSSEIADGLEITTVTGERIRLTAMPRRDEVFNRLVSLGKQQWEMW